MRPWLLTTILICSATSRSAPLAAQALSRFRVQPSALRLAPQAPPHLGPASEPLPGRPAVPVKTLPRTHWATGAIVGAVTLGLLGGLAGRSLCRMSDTAHPHCTKAFVGGTLVGGVITLGMPEMMPGKKMELVFRRK